MAIIYDAPSANWATASQTTAAPRVVYPIAQNTSAIVYERDWVQNEANWSPTALDTADATYTSAFLVEETTPQQIGGTLVTWTQRYATVPNDWSDFDERPFTFPGYYDETTDVNYRAPLTKNCTWKITHSYLKTTDPYADFDVSDFLFQSTDTYGTVLDWVDDSSTPTYTAYSGDVTLETLIDCAHTTLERYAGNIWVKRVFETKAQ